MIFTVLRLIYVFLLRIMKFFKDIKSNNISNECVDNNTNVFINKSYFVNNRL
ncbi:hypothetical protein A0H76_3011 [Hepatospora eriocheir]|uniref:Uncharacterized protein n=1 Tax=Hepatospora eriocheir TaxID=1081669 RepID=A0A1X0QK18_9MICR|nr:hypothetical protein A0H76_3011 [Hepatospora eriocheir]